MITYTEYTSDFNESFILRDNGDGSVSHIPVDESNADYQRYLRHLAGEDEDGTLS